LNKEKSRPKKMPRRNRATLGGRKERGARRDSFGKKKPKGNNKASGEKMTAITT